MFIGTKIEKVKLLDKKNKEFVEQGYPISNDIVLLLASYCTDNPECTDYRPCIDCLQMCNIAILENGKLDVVTGYEFIKDVKISKL